MVKIISLTTNFKTKISLIKVKNHMSKISCQNFSSIRRLTKLEYSFYQEDAMLKIWVAPNVSKIVNHYQANT